MGKNKLSSGLINVVTYDTQSNISLNSGSALLMSLSGSGTVTIPGNLVVLGGIAGSTAESASYSLNADKIDNLDSTQLVLTSSFNSYTSSATSNLNSLSGSVATTTSNLSSSVGSLSSSVAITTSNLSSSVGSLSSSVAITTSNLSSSVGSLSSSIATTTLNLSSSVSSSIGSLSGSVATTTNNLSGRITTIEGRYATTGSNVFVGNQIITGSICATGNIVTTGQIVAQTINVQQVTSSIVYSCGSNVFGTDINNTQTFTGSMFITGSNIRANVSNLCVQGCVTACNMFLQVPSSAAVVDILRLNNPSVVNSGTRLKFENGYGDLAAIRVIHRDNGSLADDGQIEFQVGSNASLDTKMTILNTGQIGMGTLSPAAELQVNKNCDTTIAISNCVGVISGNRGTLAWYNCATSTVAMIRAAAVTDNVGTELQFHTRPSAGSLTQRMTLSSSGNLGLGSTPDSWASGWRAFNLGANGAIAYTGAGANDFSFSLNSYYDSVDDRWEYRYTGDGASRYSMTALTSEHRWFVAPIGTANAAISWNQAMTLKSSGNLGLGTITPCSLLHITTPSTNGVLFPTILNNPYNDGVAGYGVGLRLQNSTLTGTQETNKWAGVAAIAGGSSGYSNETDLAFYVGCFISAANCTCPPVEKMRIQSSTGNVGIGLTSPSKKLDICDFNPNGTDDIVRAFQGVTTNHAFYRSQRSGGANMLIGATRDNVDGNLPANTSIVWNVSDNAMLFGTNNTERIRITGGGRVGIGETSPVSSLVVSTPSDTASLGQSGIVIQGSSTLTAGNVMALSFTAIPGTTRARAAVGSVVGSDWGKGNLTFYTRDASDGTSLSTSDEKMRITSGGNIGIGTPAPASKLNIVGGTSNAGSTSPSDYTVSIQDPTSMAAGVGGSILLQGFKTGTAAIGNYAYIVGKKENGSAGDEAGFLGLGTFNNLGVGFERIRITSTGNVGIGTCCPAGELHIVNASGSGQPVLELQQQNSGSNILQWRGSAGTYLGVIQNDGRVGINCVTPTAPLTIRCDSASGAAYMEIATCFQNAYRYVSINPGSGIEYCIPGGTSQAPYIQVQGGEPSVGGGAFRIRTGAIGSASDKLIVGRNSILSCARMSSILANNGNIQEWVGTTGVIANNTGWSLFSIANQYDNLSMDIYVFTDVGSFQGSKHEVVLSYTNFVATGIGFGSAFCIFRTGTLYNETMTICNLSGAQINNQRIAIRVWGYGVGQNGDGGSNLLNTSCLTRIA